MDFKCQTKDIQLLKPLLVENTDDMYLNSKFICSPMGNKWNALVALDHDNNIIKHSNEYLNDYEMKRSLSIDSKESGIKTLHNIYTRVLSSRDKILSSQYVPMKYGNFFLLASTFTGSNCGHELSSILDSIHFLRKHNGYTVVYFFNEMSNNNIILFRLLMPNIPIMCIKPFECIQFSHLNCSFRDPHNIGKHTYLWNELNKKIFERTKHIVSPPDVVILLKTPSDNANQSHNCFKCTKLFKKIDTMRHWTHVHPEHMSIIELGGILQRAKIIVFGFGAILYTHMHMFNPNAKYIYMSVGDHIGKYYKHIFKSGFQVLHMKNSDIDSRGDEYVDVLIKYIHKKV